MAIQLLKPSRLRNIMAPRQVAGAEPSFWTAAGVLLLANPISLTSLTPAIALLLGHFTVCLLVFVVPVTIFHYTGVRSHFLRFSLSYTVQHPIKAATFYILDVLLWIHPITGCLKPMKQALRAAASYVTPLRTLIVCRLVHGLYHPHAEA